MTGDNKKGHYPHAGGDLFGAAGGIRTLVRLLAN